MEYPLDKKTYFIGELIALSSLRRDEYLKFFQNVSDKEKYIISLCNCFIKVKFNSLDELLEKVTDSHLKQLTVIDAFQLHIFNILYSIDNNIDYHANDIKNFIGFKPLKTPFNNFSITNFEKYYLNLFKFNSIQEYFKGESYLKNLTLMSKKDRGIFITIEYDYFYILANIDECYDSLIMNDDPATIILNFEEFHKKYKIVYITEALFFTIFYGLNQSLESLDISIVINFFNNSEENLLKLFDDYIIEKYLVNFEHYSNMPLEWALEFMEDEL